MKNIFYILLIIAILIVIIFIGRNWNSIKDYFSGSVNNNIQSDGSPCTTSDNNDGYIVAGQCIPNPQGNPDPRPNTQANLQVSNPNGAFMYYQNDLASGGKLYSKSNALIPYGTKFNLIKVWQTNTSNQPFSGFYETDNKPYGAQSGFFDIKDIMKI